ncbi:MAG: NYN domain-containing protein [Isosphaerales bacterium]
MVKQTGHLISSLMRWLIDGYNVMHAGGRLGPKLGREGFRRARRRFLDELSAALGPDIARQTTVVFDASVPPGDFRLDADYRGLGVLFALGDENADARIEQLIAEHSNPKTLTVISSDRRIRQAAARRRTKSLTADEFWVLIDDFKEHKARKSPDAARPESLARDQEQQPTPAESAFWVETFGEIAEADEIQRALPPRDSLLTDADIAEIERQIEREP